MAGGDDFDSGFDAHGDGEVFGEMIEGAKWEDAEGNVGVGQDAGDAADGAVAAAGDEGVGMFGQGFLAAWIISRPSIARTSTVIRSKEKASRCARSDRRWVWRRGCRPWR